MDLGGLGSQLTALLILFGINAILASSLNIINGFCGLFSLGHAGFFAVGAYVAAACTKLWIPELTAELPYLALVIAVLCGTIGAGISGLVIGIPCLRLTGDYLAIATVGFSEIIRIVLLNTEAVGGASGMPGIALLTNLPVTLVFAVLVMWLVRNLMRSSYGRCILSVREDEIAARAMGVDVRYFKTFSFVVGSAFAGLAGALFAHYLQFIAPQNFTFQVSVQALLMIVIGGIGSQLGAILGALLVTFIPELLRLVPGIADKQMLVFGAIMVAVMLVKPDGLMGIFKKSQQKSGAA